MIPLDPIGQAIKRGRCIIKVKGASNVLEGRIEHVQLTGELFADFRENRRSTAKQVVSVVGQRLQEQHGHSNQMSLALLPNGR